MNEIIKVEDRRIGHDTIQAANARELHAHMEVGTAFKDWIARRVEDYGFEEGKDFCSFLSESSGGRPTKEYAISLDMAKELAMVERNEKGKQARQYFIECERRAKAQSPDLATEEGKLMLIQEMAAKQLALVHENRRQQAELAIAAPKVTYADAMLNADGTVLVRDAAKTIGVPVRKLERALRAKGVILSDNSPAARYVNQGYFKEYFHSYETNTRGRQVSRGARVTGLGLEFLRRFAERHADILAATPKKAAA